MIQEADGQRNRKMMVTTGFHSALIGFLTNMDREGRDEALRKLKKAGLSVRRIERLTGISRGTVQMV